MLRYLWSKIFTSPEVQDKSASLHEAILLGNHESVKSLLASKASPNAEDKEGDTPLRKAIEKKDQGMVRVLLEAKANVHNGAENGRTPLFFAVREKHPGITQLLLDLKASPNQPFGKLDIPLLQYASMSEEMAPIAEILRAAGASQIPNGQGFFIERMKKYGLEANKAGVCFGIVSTGMQKFFSGKFHEFLQLLEHIARVPEEDFKKYISTLKNDAVKTVERAKEAICAEFMEEHKIELKAETLWSREQLPQLLSKLRKRVNEKIGEYVLENKEDGLALEIPALFEAVDAYLFSRRYLHLFPKTYILTVVSDKQFKESLPKLGELLVNLSENNGFKYKVINPLGDLQEDGITQEEFKSELQDKYSAFNEALKSNEPSTLTAFLPNILTITFKRDHTLSKDIPIDNQNFLQTLPLFANHLQDEIVALDTVCGIYTNEEVEFYFSSLYDAFETFPGQIAFDIQSTNHAMGIFADSTQSPLWGFLDPNKMRLRPLPGKELAKNILDALLTEKILGLHLRIYVNKKDLSLALSNLQSWKDHPQWQAMHAITQARAQWVDDSKETWLGLAVKHNHIALVKALLEVGANSSYRANDYRSPLHVAAQNGKLEMIKLLQAKGASLEGREANGSFPLYIAAQEGHLDTVKYLLDAKIDPNTENYSGFIPLVGAAMSNRLEVLNLLLEAKSDIHNVDKEKKASVLFQAAGQGHVDIVRALINAGADVDAVTTDNATAMYIAAQNGHVEVVRALIEAKANLDIKFQKRTPLFGAAEAGHLSCVKELLLAEECRSINVCASLGILDEKNLLMCAAEKGHVEVVIELLSKGADFNVVNSNGNNALYYAASEGHLDVVDVLLNHGMTIESHQWENAFFKVGFRSGHINYSRSLGESGALVFLFKSIEQQNVKLIEFFMNRNIDPSEFINVKIHALRQGIKNQGPAAFQRLNDLLKDKPIKSNNTIQMSPLELAIVMGDPKIMNCLTKKYPISTVVCSFWNTGTPFRSPTESREIRASL